MVKCHNIETVFSQKKKKNWIRIALSNVHTPRSTAINNESQEHSGGQDHNYPT